MEVDLTVFDKVKGLAMMKCQYCNSNILLLTDKWTFCNNFNKEHLQKIAFKLIIDDSDLGFSKVVEAEVNSFNKKEFKVLEAEVNNFNKKELKIPDDEVKIPDDEVLF